MAKKVQVDKEAIDRFNKFNPVTELLPVGAGLIRDIGNNWYRWKLNNMTFISKLEHNSGKLTITNTTKV